MVITGQAYAEVIVTPDDDLAHRLRPIKLASFATLKNYPGYEPACGATSQRPMHPMSAGWAASHGYDGCPDCYPEERS